MTTNETPPAKRVKPHQIGWLRRPELDTLGDEVWERPDGKLHIHDPNQGKLELYYMDMRRKQK
jgi:hypothetical protein